MQDSLEEKENIAGLYADQLLRKGVDEAFVMEFGTEIQVTQQWADRADLIASLQPAFTPFQTTTVHRVDVMPPDLTRDGAFHRITIRCKLPKAVVLARSGYYALAGRN